MKTTQARIEVTCPCCDKKSFSPGVCMYYSCNCSHCGALLIVNKGSVYSLSERMAEQFPGTRGEGASIVLK